MVTAVVRKTRKNTQTSRYSKATKLNVHIGGSYLNNSVPVTDAVTKIKFLELKCIS